MSASIQNELEKVVIVGTGPAGLTAAIYAARANLSPLVIEGDEPGGQLTITSDVENYPGFAEAVLGPDLMIAFKKQAERFSTRFIPGQVTAVEMHVKERPKKPIELTIANGQVVKTQTLIIATGASAKWLGFPSEKKYFGKGVSACATCDGFFFKGQDVAVVGGGDTAMEEATFLTRFANKVTVIHRRDALRASKIMQEKAMANPKIEWMWDSHVTEVLGGDAVEGVRVENLKTKEKTDLMVKGFFVAIGHLPNTDLFKKDLEMNEAGYLQIEKGTSKTKVPGVFAAGDVADPYYRQAVTAAGTGCMAAMDAERFLELWEYQQEQL